MTAFTIRTLATTLTLSALLPASAWLSEGCTPKAVEAAEMQMEMPDGSPKGSFTIMPSTANVLTCDSLSLSSVGIVLPGSWTLHGAGKLTGQGVLPTITSATSVTYTGPNVTPSPATVTVTEVVSGLGETSSGSATLTLATAFLGAADSLPIAGNTNVGQPYYPLAHTFAASSNRVYAGIGGPSTTNDAGDSLVNAMQVYSSTNGGTSFTKASSYPTGNLFCGAVAVDVGDPSVVYLAYAAGHGDATTNTGSSIRLAVSPNCAETFPVEYVMADTGIGNPRWAGCPDVVSPSANHVIVSNVFDPGGENWVATFVSNNQGAGIGEIAADDGDAGSGYVATSDTNSGAMSTNAINADAQLSPQIFTNGKGGACVVYIEYASTAVNVQCSSNNGTTWSSPANVAGSTIMNSVATGAISAAGNVAIAYQQANSSGGSETFVVISKNGGQSWEPAVRYPLPSWAGTAEQTVEAFLGWETDSILWLSETVAPATGTSDLALLVDKTCDFGQTWSGAINAGFYGAAGFVQTGTGMVVGGDVPSNDPSGKGPLLALIPLAP